MKQLFFVILSCFFIACHQSTPKKTPETDQTQLDLTDVEASDIFTTSTGEILDTKKLQKYESVSGKGDSKLSVLTTAIPEGCSALHLKLSDLTKGTKIAIYKFDHNMTADAQLLGFTGSIGKKEMLFIEDYIRFKTIQCNGVDQRIGIGLRCFIHVKSKHGKISYSQLPKVAANVELSNAEASFSLESLGFAINGSVLESGLPTDGDYNVENFGKLSVIFHNVVKTLDDSNATLNIDPVILPLAHDLKDAQ